ncbi:hypothetical protein C5B94_03875 [Clavibacter michiganensis]|uniref:FDXHR family putative zinc-binding protein n=1 Tax=Clavibacter michiganensis TaxID=28447 RepID=UPI000CE7A4AF|nr:hypothetical protein [Clavibacter michiganensis]PPF56068.1 hypothetical protein C5B94_03875 [Clavibacter michiganensis]
MAEQTLTTHAACGKSWRQRGNRTGHCAACHETFEGITAFDAHQAQQPDGSVKCRDPRDTSVNGHTLRLVDGTWRGPAMPKDTFKAARP